MEITQLHKNSFEGGLNTDVNPNVVNSTQFIEAHNLSLVESGKFLALQNLKGTVELEKITALDNTSVLGVFNNKFKIGADENVDCLTIFTVEVVGGSGLTGTFNIYCYDIVNDDLYLMYSEDAPMIAPAVAEINSLIDGISYSEKGFDYLYFTDFLNRPRKLKCYVPLPYTSDFLVEKDLELLKVPALGDISLDEVTTGGSLLTGTYQLAYQMLNIETGKYTGFSLLTNPIHVYTTINSITLAGIGLASNKKIVVNITPTEDELAYYTHFRLAVVENIGTASQSTVNVGLTAITEIAELTGFEIISNTQYNTTTIDEIVIDLAAIDKVKTITTRQNRLLLGNVELAALEYDNGVPVIEAGEVIIDKGAIGEDSATNDTFVSTRKGYFRDELYRFAISYYDDYGRFSNPSVLDLSSVVHNQITSGVDIRFPRLRDILDSTYYSIMDEDSRAQVLGLRLARIKNHPSWAKGFVILRAKRKKKILFQTPVLPMSKIHGLGSAGNYPTIRRDGDVSNTVTDTTATPMGPSVGFVPYNMFYGACTQTTGLIRSRTGSGVDQQDIGECGPLVYTKEIERAMIFDPYHIYDNNPTLFSGSEVSSLEDIILCKAYKKRLEVTTPAGAPNISTNITVSNFTTDNEFRYYDHGHSGIKTDFRPTAISITNNKSFDNYNEGDFLAGIKVNDYSLFKTGNVNFGANGNVHKQTVVDYNTTNIGEGAGSSVPTFTGGSPTFISTTTYNGYNALDTYAYDGDYYSTPNPALLSFYGNILEIANISNNLSDDRYGKVDSENEYLYTGTKVVFTNAEQVSIKSGAAVKKTVDVWGGDCIVSSHTFKISNVVPVTNNQPKFTSGGLSLAGGINTWDKIWLTDNGSAYFNMPVMVKGPQYLTVLLESEFNGSVTDRDLLDLVTTENGYNIYGTSDVSKGEVPRNYNYNININKQNDQKVFIQTDNFSLKTTKFKARLYYSDLKIYQSDIDGFDSVRVLNYLDLEERFGGLTKLEVVQDNLVGLQENAITIIPVGERVIETTDLSQLSVRSGEFLGIPVYVDTLYGCQHIGSVKSTGKFLYFLDKKNRAICKFTGGPLEIISGKGLSTELRNTLDVNIQIYEDGVKSIYDTLKDQYLLTFGYQQAYVWNEGLQLWESKLDLPFQGGVRTDNGLFLVGKDITTSDTTLYSFGNGLYSHFFGGYVTPSVKFISNPESDTSKVWDSLLVNSTNPLDTAFVSTVTASGTQIAPTQAFSTQRGEGNWKLKILRDTSGLQNGAGEYINRIRGPYAIVDLNWNSGASFTAPNTLTSVITKYRPSFNLF